MTTNAESNLLQLTSDMEELECVNTNDTESDNSGEESPNVISYPALLSTEVEVEDISDLQYKNKLAKPLSEIDYLVLTDYSLGKTPNEISEKFNLSKSKLNQLLRNPKAIELVEELTENTRKKSLATATALEAKGVELMNLMVNTNIEAGNYETALKLLFGKLSLTEVTERMAKRGEDKEANPTVQINQLFTDLSGR